MLEERVMNDLCRALHEPYRKYGVQAEESPNSILL